MIHKVENLNNILNLTNVIFPDIIYRNEINAMNISLSLLKLFMDYEIYELIYKFNYN